VSAEASPRLRALIERSTPRSSVPAAQEAPEHCELCGVPVPAEHRHVIDLDLRELMCACHLCAVLFDREGAGGHHYRLVPDRRLALADFRLDEPAWRSLRIPVDMAYFVRAAGSGRVTAFYPSPAGPTESTLELESWDEIERENPVLTQMAPEVEALLVNRTGAGREAWLVGVDECYRLVAVVRRHWRGFGGGDEVWRAIDAFFAGLRDRAT
jgi:hypothetical protein